MTSKQIFDAENYVKARKEAEARLIEAGIYSPEMEHDACGVGFVASIDGLSLIHISEPTRPY